MANPEDFDIDAFLADPRRGKSDAELVDSLTGTEPAAPAAKPAPVKRHAKKADDFDIDAFLAKRAAPKAETAPAHPGVNIDPKKGAVPTNRVYARFTDMPGQKFTAEQLGNVKLDTSKNVPIALAGGALQGATGYFGDELAAAAGSLMGDGEYSKLRDENRSVNKYAQSLSPTNYAIGELVGGALNPANKLIPGAAGKPLLSLRNTTVAGGMGGLTGLGASDADLTKGQFGGAIKDTAIGTGIGVAGNTVLGGLGKAVKYAAKSPERLAKKADDILIDKLSLGATAEQRDSLVGELGKDKGKVLSFVRSTPELKEAVLSGNYTRAAEILREQKAAGEGLKESTIKALEERWGKQEAQPVVDSLEKLRAKYAANPATESQRMAAEIEKRIEAVKDRWIPEPPKPEPKGKELLATLSEGANASEKQKIGENSDLFEKVIKKHKLGPAANDPEARYSAVGGALDELGKRKEALYGKVKEKPLITDVTVPLTKLRDELSQTADGTKLAPAVEDMIKRIWASHGRGGKRLEMGVKELRELISKTQEAGFAGPYFDPSVAQGLQRQVAGVMKDALDSHIAKHGGEKVLSGIAELNKEYQVLLTLRDVAERQRAAARLVPPAAPDTRTGQAGVGELFELANTTENPEAKAAIMSSLTKQMDKGAGEQLSKLNADKALIEQIEAPIVKLGTRNATPPTTLRSGVRKIADLVGHAGAGAAGMALATGNWKEAAAIAGGSLALKYGPEMGAKAQSAMARMVTAMRAGASRAHLEKIGKFNKLPKYVTDDMIETLLPRTTAGEVVGRTQNKESQ